MSELTGGLTNYYLVTVQHPQREDQPPYQAECEDIAEALQLTPNEFCEFKAIWRTAAARLGNGKPGQKALYDAQKRVHYATRDLKKLERELNPAPLVLAPGTVVEDGWIVHGGNEMPEALEGSELIEVRVDGGQEYTGNFAKPASDWKWFTDGRCLAITHYRLLKVESFTEHPYGVVDVGLALVGEPGWYSHTPGPRPAGVGPNDLVQIRLSNGHEVAVPRKAAAWDWAYKQELPDKAPHIEAWRFA